jgi:hypothetical protein
MAEKMLVLRPEMSGMILDKSHFKFHVECKAKIVNAVNKMKKGGDFLKALSKLNFSTDKKWTKNTCGNPNVKVLLEILEEYKKLEHRPSRLGVLVPIIEYAIGLYASDLFYTERGEWFLYQICKRSKELQFNACFVNPQYWYPNMRATPETFKAENDPNAPDINHEYITWYGVDPTVDNCVISYDMTKVNELIERQKKQFEIEYGNTNRWAEEELEKI